MNFKLKSKFKPAGDQPRAINKLYKGLKKGYEHQTLLGVTGSGKTFTIANVIEKIQKPALVIARNKTLAAQLVSEFWEFFPESAVEYFVSYYDYYQPEVAEEYLKMESFEDIPKVIKIKEEEIKKFARNLKFEEAAMTRDEIAELKKIVRK